MIEVRKYKAEDKKDWDSFVSQSDNGFFFFKRDFLEYHHKPFIDHSLLVYDNNKLKALVPINTKDHKAYSHQGITYGGLITPIKCKYADYILYINEVFNYLKKQNLHQISIKIQPSVYFRTQSNKLDVIIQRNKLNIDECLIGAVLNCQHYILPTKRKLNIKSSLLKNHIFSTETELSDFWKLVEICYPSRFGFKPVHSFDEISYLAKTFESNISIMSLREKSSNKLVAGLMVFEDDRMAKIQYIAYDEKAIDLINLLYYETLDYYLKKKKSVDWGLSMDVNDGEVNTSILWLKEKFGASPIAVNTITFDLEPLKI